MALDLTGDQQRALENFLRSETFMSWQQAVATFALNEGQSVTMPQLDILIAFLRKVLPESDSRLLELFGGELWALSQQLVDDAWLEATGLFPSHLGAGEPASSRC